VKILEGLNSDQLKAVAHRSGPCLIIAGAGTGKTTVITRKIAFLIEKKLAQPSQILALTFTEKAASEMEERVDLLVPYGFVDTWIMTFHAFGDRILRNFAIDLGLPANFKVLSQTEQAIFIRQNLFAFDLNYYRPIANPTSHIEELLRHFSRLKDELIAPSDYLRFAQVKSEKNNDEIAEVEKTLELANAYERYQDLMLQAGNLDYGDQIFLTYKLLKENSKVLKECQEKFKYILIDEFQDTNYAQYEIVKLLAKSQKNITVVGDDDQSIYRFRGASISNILNFKKHYPDCTQIVLNQNYRSTAQILDASYKLIKHNNPDRLEVKNKINKKLVSSKQGVSPQLIYCENLSSETDQVIGKIEKLKKSGKYEYGDIVILARSNNSLEPFLGSLNSRGIPNLFVGSSSLFARAEVKMLVSFFKCLVYPDDNLAFYQLAVSDLYGANEDSLLKHYVQAKRQNRTFEEIFENRGNDKKIIEILSDLSKYRKKMKSLRSGEILYEFLKEKRYLKKLTSDNSVEAEIAIANIAKFFDRIAQFDQTSNDQSVHSFLENLELIMEVGDEVISSDIDPDLNAVNLMTVHGAKGLEWPVVFIVNVVSERFPTRKRSEPLPIPEDLIREKLPAGDFHLQEERRLFYVGATRAKEQLYISAAGDYGGKRAKKISQFVLELFDDANLQKVKHKLSSIEKISQFSTKQPITARHMPKKTGGILRLSRQQIDDYHTCPKKYYFVSVLKIPLPTDWRFMYGSAIHETLQRYFSRKLKSEKPGLDSMLLDFETFFRNEGFITRSHEDERHRSAIETLTRFHDEDKQENLIPAHIEEKFEFVEGNIKINGRYDIVLKPKSGAEIVDFKTSDVKEEKDAQRRLRESTQMKIYALAWLEKYGKIPKTTLHFIESNLKAVKTFDLKELEKTRELVRESGKGIQSGDFTAKPELRKCKYCPYRHYCNTAILK